MLGVCLERRVEWHLRTVGGEDPEDHGSSDFRTQVQVRWQSRAAAAARFNKGSTVRLSPDSQIAATPARIRAGSELVS